MNSMSRTHAGGSPVSLTHLVAASIGINVLALALPVMTLQIYDRILPNEGSGTLPVLMVGVSIAIAIEAALRLTRSWLLGWYGAVYEYRMSCHALGHVLAADLPDMLKRGAGEYLHQMAAIGKLRDFNNGYIPVTLIDLAFIPVFLGFVIYIAGPLAIVPACGLMVLVLLSLAQGQHLRRLLSARDHADDQRYNFLIETLGAIHTLKSLTLEKLFLRKYEQLEERSARRNFTTAEATAQTFNTCTTLGNVIVVATILLGALLALHHEITSGALVATLLLSGRMMQMVQRGMVLWVKYQDAGLARQKVASLLEEPLRQDSRAIIDTDNNAHITSQPGGSLAVRSLAYIPAGADQPLIDIDDFHLNPGEAVWISGATGSGKTTLLRLLAGVLSPTRGEILIDGQHLRRYNPAQLARHIGYISAEPVIFRGTIRHNITRFGDIDALHARRAATQLGIDKDIARLPLGFDTFLQGNISDTIPPGLKQRIAMARVIAAMPGILLLDGADMSLDRHGQKQLVDHLRAILGRISLIIISEEPAMQNLAGRHLHLHNGKLQECAMATTPAKDAP